MQRFVLGAILIFLAMLVCNLVWLAGKMPTFKNKRRKLGAMIHETDTITIKAVRKEVETPRLLARSPDRRKSLTYYPLTGNYRVIKGHVIVLATSSVGAVVATLTTRRNKQKHARSPTRPRSQQRIKIAC